MDAYGWEWEVVRRQPADVIADLMQMRSVRAQTKPSKDDA